MSSKNKKSLKKILQQSKNTITLPRIVKRLVFRKKWLLTLTHIIFTPFISTLAIRWGGNFFA